MGTRGRLHSLLHETDYTEAVLGKSGVLELVQEHADGALVPVGDASRQYNSLVFRQRHVFVLKKTHKIKGT